ncbi:MAG: nicotinic acid mononucleotide adenyltransferase [Flavobacteriaceae bacterium]|nr:nicotinic acid mononucleotide adenyltransferase [Flavobacteriaceae bacterium]OUX30955.1 MAG: hypothetical protein CBE18_02170 [Pelagibacteraceae bacterium TMED258]|tara:strand:+ start:2277 stop:2645 length:369 start_codon:yes stop_codon:yes gene_type:complete
MKKIFLLFISISIFSYSAHTSAQKENKTIEYNQFTELIDITYFYDNGVIQQKGSFNINGLPHGEWTSYNISGKKLCVGNYSNGLKQGKWYFILPTEVQTVDYYNSKIISVKNTQSEDIAALK